MKIALIALAALVPTLASAEDSRPNLRLTMKAAP